MLMDPRRARGRHPPGAHAGSAATSPPASNRRLAPPGLPALHSRLLGSPAAGGGRLSLWPKCPRWWRSARTWSCWPRRRARRGSGSRCRGSAVEGPERALLRGEGDSDSSAGWKDPGVWAATLG
ncbi:Transient Receptor Potential Cation Channel Subfamily V Member 6 [Manis pentadactyla]|nr:Transient Receptor Potential Cation Channel Subfamily V Member 6 [Manis pentadactyla]